MAGNLSTADFFAILSYEVGQFSFGVGVNNIGGGKCLAGAQAHI
ncbi:hypothetical protein ES707_18299 [subsurface metagenome]